MNLQRFASITIALIIFHIFAFIMIIALFPSFQNGFDFNLNYTGTTLLIMLDVVAAIIMIKNIVKPFALIACCIIFYLIVYLFFS